LVQPGFWREKLLLNILGNAVIVVQPNAVNLTITCLLLNI
jgi:hypothetical protein